MPQQQIEDNVWDDNQKKEIKDCIEKRMKIVYVYLTIFSAGFFYLTVATIQIFEQSKNFQNIFLPIILISVCLCGIISAIKSLQMDGEFLKIDWTDIPHEHSVASDKCYKHVLYLVASGLFSIAIAVLFSSQANNIVLWMSVLVVLTICVVIAFVTRANITKWWEIIITQIACVILILSIIMIVTICRVDAINEVNQQNSIEEETNPNVVWY